MNGGRLSNDETFLLGLNEMRLQLTAATPDPEAADRALGRIGVRYPEEAEQLRGLWRQQRPECGALLTALEAQHSADSEEA